MRKVHHLIQGSDEWKAHRATTGMINGSEIAAMMGIDKKTSRGELLRMKAIGGEKEFSDYVQDKVLNKGHENEALARPLAEAIIGDDLSPLVMTDEIEGLLFSVSLDGITQGKDTTHEHKSLNMMFIDALDAGTLPEENAPQCEAGLMVSGATRCLFMASKDGDAKTARHYWYLSRPDLRKRMIAACRQFAIDLAAYVHVEQAAAPVASAIEALPALMIQVEGKVLATNLDAFKEAAQTFIANINTELVNDQDFADADKMVKFLKDGEDRLALCKDQAQSQAKSIDELFRTIDAISEQMRSKRLALDKLVKAEKDNRRSEILREANNALMDHTDRLNRRVGGFMPRTINTFADAIKGLKSLDSMRDKVSAALANAKIEANEIADRIEINKRTLDAQDDIYMALFPDLGAIITKPNGDFMDTVNARIAKHNEAQAAKDKAAKEYAAKEYADALVAAAVEAERKAGGARAAETARIAAAAIEAEAKRIADAAQKQAADDQRAKADAGVGLAMAGRAQPDTASSPPLQQPDDGTTATAPATPEQSSAVAVGGIFQSFNGAAGVATRAAYYVDVVMIESFLALQDCDTREKAAMRATIEKWENYRIRLDSASKVAA